tara:strand:- start:2383 stop:2706 length:324 start_codon:yes stop_codon:yes gene_type:complete
MVEIRALDGTNWMEFLSLRTVVFIIGRSDCSDCHHLYQEMHSIELPAHWVVGKLDLDQPNLGGFRNANPWLEHIDMVPFTTVFVDGEMAAHWAGVDTTRLKESVQSL